jgi:uncharacterized membrane protein
LSGKQNRRRHTSGATRRPQATQRSQAAVREQKRSQFEKPKSRTRMHLALAAVALVAVAVIAAVVMVNRGGGAQAATATAAAPSGNVTMPVSQVSDGKAHFFTYNTGGTTVRYFVLADKNGTVRAALDACEVCYAQKKGYHQQGDAMQCNNCGKIFPSAQINVITGGCNPIPLKKTISGGQLTITPTDLQQGAQYF